MDHHQRRRSTLSEPFTPTPNDGILTLGDGLAEGARIELRITRIEQELYQLGGISPEELSEYHQTDQQFLPNSHRRSADARIAAAAAIRNQNHVLRIRHEGRQDPQQGSQDNDNVIRPESRHVFNVLLREAREAHLQRSMVDHLIHGTTRETGLFLLLIIHKELALTFLKAINNSLTEYAGEINEDAVCGKIRCLRPDVKLEIVLCF